MRVTARPSGVSVRVMLVRRAAGRNAGAAVEDDQGAGVELEPGEVTVELVQADGQGVRPAGVPHPQLDGLPLDLMVAVGLADEQVDPPAADAVLAVDEALPVYATALPPSH